MKRGKMQVGKVEHYATYVALLISMFTTFLLGILLTEGLFNRGVNYFDRLGDEARIRKASAAGERLLRRGQLSGGGAAGSFAIFNGHVEYINDDNSALDSTISIGVPFTATVPLPYSLDDIDPSTEWAYIQVPGPVRYSVGSIVMDYPDPMLIVHDAGFGIDYIAIDGRTFSGVYALSQAGWTDTSVLTNDILPRPFSRAAGSGDSSLIEMRLDPMSTSTPWTIIGEVDSIVIR